MLRGGSGGRRNDQAASAVMLVVRCGGGSRCQTTTTGGIAQRGSSASRLGRLSFRPVRHSFSLPTEISGSSCQQCISVNDFVCENNVDLYFRMARRK